MNYKLLLKFPILIIIFSCIVDTIYAQKSDSLRIKAKDAFSAKDYATAHNLYSALDSIDNNLAYIDLWRYYISSEEVVDEEKSKDLLFRLLNSAEFEPADISKKRIDKHGINKRSYWQQADSLLNLVIASRCQPFIDSLKNMAEIDRNIKHNGDSSYEKYVLMRQIDSVNTLKLQQLIKQYGFPTWKLVGRTGAHDAWLIAQHSGTEFLPWYIKYLRKAVLDNNSDKIDYVIMEDRYQMFEGLPQFYGSQYTTTKDSLDRNKIIEQGFYMIADIDNINERRKSLGLNTIEEFAKEIGCDSVTIHSYYSDYSDYYLAISQAKRYYCLESYLFVTYRFESNFSMYHFPKDIEMLCLSTFQIGDTVKALHLAKNMVLFGQKLEDEWNLPQFLMDSVVAEYNNLRQEYERQISFNKNSILDTISSFDMLVNILDSGYYPRYCIDAWNGNIKNVIDSEAQILDANNYIAFFDWLYTQVVKGNYYLYDYAELYDEVYNRLFGKSYFGEKLFADGLRISPSEVEITSNRRRSVHLPALWVRCDLGGIAYPEGYKKETYEEYYSGQ